VRAERRQRRALGRAGDLGQEDLATRAERTRRMGHRDAGIAARGHHHAGRGHRQATHAVEHAARLEAAAELQVFELEPDLGHVEPELPAGQPPQRRAAHVAGDAPGGEVDGGAVEGQIGWGHRGPRKCRCAIEG
jgi:hypothetical protein